MNFRFSSLFRTLVILIDIKNTIHHSMSTIPNDQTIDEVILTKYDVIAKLGSGAYGHVWKVLDKKQNKQYALKKVYSAFQNDLDAERTFRQISILKKLDHPNIVKLKKVFRAKNDFDLYLVFELIESDIFKALKGKFLNDLHKKYIIYQIAKALKYIHSAGVLHRDLKPSNILIDTECKIKICDFGLARTTFNYSSTPQVITQFIATRWYRAPEVMLGSQSYNQKADIWSFGCLIYEMYAHKALLPGKDNVDQIEKMLQFKGFPNEEQKQAMKVNSIDKILGHFSTERKLLTEYFCRIEDIKLKKLLLKIFQYDPGKRPSAQQILKHNFLQELFNYQSEPESQIKVQLQHNQNIKLSAKQYRELIYDKFAEKQSGEIACQQKIKQKNNLDKMIDCNSINERTLKKKSTHLIKQSATVPVETSENVKQQMFQSCKNQLKLEKQNVNQSIQRKKSSISLHESIKNTPKSFKRIHKRDKSQMPSVKQINYMLQNTYPKQETQKQSVLKFKKRTIKHNSLHKNSQDKENIVNQNNIKQNEVKQNSQIQQSVKLHIRKDRVIAYSVDSSPQHNKQQVPINKNKSLGKPLKSIVQAYDQTNQDQVILKSQQSEWKQRNDARIQKQNKLYPEKRVSQSMHSSLHDSPVHNSIHLSSNHSSISNIQKHKLPQLIVKKPIKIKPTKSSTNENYLTKTKFLNRPFHQITNEDQTLNNAQNYSKNNEIGSILSRNQSIHQMETGQLQSKKIHKKAISHLYQNNQIKG